MPTIKITKQAGNRKGQKMRGLCVVCGKEFEVTNKFGTRRKTCGSDCTRVLRSMICKQNGSVPPSQLGKRVKGAKHRRVTTQGYIELYEGDTPAFRILEHRKIIQDHLGRKLDSCEQVHHINGNKQDNRIKNLMLFENASEHTKYHRKGGLHA